MIKKIKKVIIKTKKVLERLGKDLKKQRFEDKEAVDMVQGFGDAFIDGAKELDKLIDELEEDEKDE